LDRVLQLCSPMEWHGDSCASLLQLSAKSQVRSL
jgi:hypothetical protein